MRRPLTSTRSEPSEIVVPRAVTTCPLTLTAPEVISDSAWRRDETPACARYLCNRILATGGYSEVGGRVVSVAGGRACASPSGAGAAASPALASDAGGGSGSGAPADAARAAAVLASSSADSSASS